MQRLNSKDVSEQRLNGKGVVLNAQQFAVKLDK